MSFREGLHIIVIFPAPLARCPMKCQIWRSTLLTSHDVLPPGHKDVVLALLECRPVVDSEDLDGCTPMLLAAEGGKKGLAAAKGLAFAHGKGL
jgi:hypothetical protein